MKEQAENLISWLMRSQFASSPSDTSDRAALRRAFRNAAQEPYQLGGRLPRFGKDRLRQQRVVTVTILATVADKVAAPPRHTPLQTLTVRATQPSRLKLLRQPQRTGFGSKVSVQGKVSHS
jgi:hypothetical protein